MSEKIGRNAPCPCHSGKKYKQCCMSKTSKGPGLGKRFTAKVLSSKPTEAVPLPPAGPDLIERTFESIRPSEKTNPEN